MSTEGCVTTERHGHVLLIGLDRVAKRNAFDKAMLHALGQAYSELDRDENLRCGVLFAHGDHFTAGLELTQFAGTLGQGVQGLQDGELDPLGIQGPQVTKPMVCALQGYCWTVGIELMLATDIRIAASTTRFAQIEIKRGIYPVGGATIRFVHEAGWGNAMRYLLTGDEFGAAEALRIGLVQEVVELGQQLARAEEIAQTIAIQVLHTWRISYGFTELELHRIEAIIDIVNGRSKGLLLKLGFTYEGNLRQRYFFRDRFEDEHYFGLLKDEWYGSA